MKLAIVTPNVYIGDGQGRVNYELTRHLLTSGISVDLIADRVAPELLDAGAGWIPVHPGFDNLILARVYRFQKQVDRVLDRVADRYDAVLACGRVTTRPHTVNVLHFVHSAWLASDYHPIRQRFGLDSAYQYLFTRANARWELETLSEAESIVAVSNKIKGELIDAGVQPDRIQTILNGVDTDEFRPGPVRRDSLGLPEDVPLAFFAGDIQSSRKNLDTILRGLRNVPDLHVAVAGRLDGSPYPTLARDLGVLDRTHFLGFRRDVPDLMRAADMFVFPSRYEACTLALLEAMASGLPVVTAETTGGAELVTGNCGFLLENPDDVDTLVENLRLLTSKPHVRIEMGQAARAVAEDHSWTRMSERYLHLLNTPVAA
jgi:glycosyltransferase involved in cell wall biosynthesis